MNETVLIREAARSAVRDVMNQTPLREIDQMWGDEDFPRVARGPDFLGGERRSLFQRYLDQVDWGNRDQVVRALRVFEVAVEPIFASAEPVESKKDPRERIRRLFANDGVIVTKDGRFISRVQIPALSVPLDAISNPSVIREHLNRIRNAAINEDPAQAIGSAKELIESTAKLSLAQMGSPAEGREDLPELIKLVQEKLHIHPTKADPGPERTGTVKKILGASSSIAISVAELRNAGYGTGHGGATPRTGLGPRHARLAVNGAITWCEFILDTLADENAPWRKKTGGS